MSRLRICAADALFRPAVVQPDLLCAFFAALSGLPGECFQTFLLVGVRLLPIRAGRFADLNEFFRRAGSIGSDVGQVRTDHPPADKALCDALPHDLIEQPPEYLAEGQLPVAQLRDRA